MDSHEAISLRTFIVCSLTLHLAIFALFLREYRQDVPAGDDREGIVYVEAVSPSTIAAEETTTAVSLRGACCERSAAKPSASRGNLPSADGRLLRRYPPEADQPPAGAPRNDTVHPPTPSRHSAHAAQSRHSRTIAAEDTTTTSVSLRAAAGGEAIQPLRQSAPSRHSRGPLVGISQSHATGSPNGDRVLTNIYRRLAKARYYPREARRQHLEGRPVVTFRITDNGHVAHVALARSSGESILDAAALETVRRAAPFPPYDQAITTAIRYELR